MRYRLKIDGVWLRKIKIKTKRRSLVNCPGARALEDVQVQIIMLYWAGSACKSNHIHSPRPDPQTIACRPQPVHYYFLVTSATLLSERG